MADLYLLKYPYRRVLGPLALRMRSVNPDVVSYVATAITVGAAGCYLAAHLMPPLLLIAVGLTLLRMTLNTMDGVIAIARGNLSLKGEIVNALPDRYSDILLVGGIALSPLCGPMLGLLGLASMFLVSYAGMLGKAVEVEWQHHGPLGKVERLILVMVFSLVQYLHLAMDVGPTRIFGLTLTPLEWCMILFIVLGQIAVARRVRGTVRQIARHEWPSRREAFLAGKRILVAWDSKTGNTRRVAEAIAESLHADAKHVDDVESVADYDFVVLGSPIMSSKPSPKMIKFIERHPDIRDYALCVTYGMPVWGRISTGRCLTFLTERLGAPPRDVFSCKGYHTIAKTYKKHPTEDEILSAYLFGIRLSRAWGALQ